MQKISGVKSGVNEASGNSFISLDLLWINTAEQSRTCALPESRPKCTLFYININHVHPFLMPKWHSAFWPEQTTGVHILHGPKQVESPSRPPPKRVKHQVHFGTIQIIVFSPAVWSPNTELQSFSLLMLCTRLHLKIHILFHYVQVKGLHVLLYFHLVSRLEFSVS